MLTPDLEAVKDALQRVLTLRQEMLAWSHMLAEACIPPPGVQSEQDGWWLGAVNVLKASQGRARKWILASGPALFRSFTQPFVEFGVLFEETASELAAVLQSGSPPERMRQDLAACVEGLKTQAARNEELLRKVERDLEADLRTMREDLAALKAVTAPAKQAKARDEDKLRQLAATVEAVRTRHAVAFAEFESSLLVDARGGIAAMKLVWPVTGGVLVTAISRSMLKSVGAAGGGLVMANLMYLYGVAKQFLASRKLREENDALVQELENLTVLQQQRLISSATADQLQILSDALSQLPSLSAGLSGQWQLTHARVEAMLGLLEQPGVSLDRISDLHTSKQAAARWMSIAELCRKIQSNMLEQLDVRVDEIRLEPRLSVVS